MTTPGPRSAAKRPRAPTAAEVAADVVAGLLVGLLTIVNTISCASLIFSGELDPLLSAGTAIALLGATVITTVVALTSSTRFTIAGPDTALSALLGLTTVSIAAELRQHGQAAATFDTVWVAVAVATGSTGLFLFALGRLRLGRFVRTIPYPVVGGFLAGTGWFIAKGGLTMLTGIALGLDSVRRLGEPAVALRWLPSLAFALVLFFSMRRWKHFLVLPGLLAGGIAAAHAVRVAAGMSIATAVADGWLLAAPTTSLLRVLDRRALHDASWSAISDHTLDLFPLFAVTAINVLLSATAIEIASREDSDLDRELRAAGAANLASGLLGGSVGSHSVSRTVLNLGAGGKGRLSGLVAAAVCLAVQAFAGGMLPLLPRPVLGAMLLYLGMNLLYEWVGNARRLPQAEHALVVTILAVVAWAGFIPGVVFGTVVACVLFAVANSRIEVVRFEQTGADQRSNVMRSTAAQRVLAAGGETIRVLHLQGAIFFGTANQLLERVRSLVSRTDVETRYVIIDFRRATSVDSSAAFSFAKLRQLASREGFTVVLTGATEAQLSRLLQGDLPKPNDAWLRTFVDLDHGTEWCEQELLLAHGRLSTSIVPPADELGLTPEQTALLDKYFKAIEAPSGYTLFEQGDAPDAMFLIEEGRVTIWLRMPTGENKRLRTLNTGLVGEMGLFTGERRTAAAVADGDARLRRLSAEGLREMQHADPDLAVAISNYVIRSLAERLAHADKQVQQLVRGD